MVRLGSPIASTAATLFDALLAMSTDAAPRAAAEAKVEAVLSICATESERALLFRILRNLGWTTERADRFLRQQGWD